MNAYKPSTDDVEIEVVKRWWCECCYDYHFEEKPDQKHETYYLCPNCGEDWTEKQRAINCCGEYGPDANWVCGSCDEGWATKALAEACCVKDDDEPKAESKVEDLVITAPDPLDRLLGTTTLP